MRNDVDESGPSTVSGCVTVLFGLDQKLRQNKNQGLALDLICNVI